MLGLDVSFGVMLTASSKAQQHTVSARRFGFLTVSKQVPKPCLRFTDNLKKDDIWTQSRQNLEEAIEEEKENTSHRWDPDLLSHEQRLEQRLDKLNLDMYIMGSDGACQVGRLAALGRGDVFAVLAHVAFHTVALIIAVHSSWHVLACTYPTVMRHTVMYTCVCSGACSTVGLLPMRSQQPDICEFAGWLN